MRLHRFALATAVATYVLLIVGGLVHATGSSLACPDWPLCHGSLLPKMEHGVEYEHTHRLVAGTVAVLTMVLSVLVLRDPARRALRPLAVAAPLMVLAQALLGGLTVLWKLPKLITLSHLTLSMCFFSVMVILAIRSRPGLTPPAEQRSDRARALVALSAAAVLAQITLGGLVRHSMAGLACITFPFCSGQVWPKDSSAEQIHMLHRYGAAGVGLLVVVASVQVLRTRASADGDRRVRVLAAAAPALVLVQGTLGVLSVTSLLHRATVIAHLGVGALLLATMVGLWTRLGLAWSAPAALRATAGDATEPACAPAAEPA